MSQAMGKIIGQVVRALAMDLPDVSDGDLLARYLANRDADAFAALVRRHGPMVRGVCRRILRHEHDAEDAFQATFLVLVRKANTIKPKDVVGNWLYGVAYQTAVRARALAAKRRGRETTPADLAEPIATIDRKELCDLLPLLDKKLNALPDKYRAPIVLCDLEGKTRKEAAHQLGWPEGTVAGRLARGRAILARRLGQLIGTLSVALSAEAAACVPVPLVEATLRAAAMFAAGSAATVISGPVVALTQGVLQAMFLTKLKTTIAVLLCIGISGVGAGGLLYRTQAANPQVGDNAPAPQVNPTKTQDSRADNPLVAQPKPSALDANAPKPIETPPIASEQDASKNQRKGLFEPEPLRIPGPPTVEELRAKYLKLQDDFSKHLSRDQLQQRAHELEKELAAAQEKAQRLAREKQADDELAKAKAILVNISAQHKGTAAAHKAEQALQMLNMIGAADSVLPTPTNLYRGPELPTVPSDKKQ